MVLPKPIPAMEDDPISVSPNALILCTLSALAVKLFVPTGDIALVLAIVLLVKVLSYISWTKDVVANDNSDAGPVGIDDELDAGSATGLVTDDGTGSAFDTSGNTITGTMSSTASPTIDLALALDSFESAFDTCFHKTIEENALSEAQLTVANLTLHDTLTPGPVLRITYYGDEDDFLLTQSIQSAAFVPDADIDDNELQVDMTSELGHEDKKEDDTIVSDQDVEHNEDMSMIQLPNMHDCRLSAGLGHYTSESIGNIESHSDISSDVDVPESANIDELEQFDEPTQNNDEQQLDEQSTHGLSTPIDKLPASDDMEVEGPSFSNQPTSDINFDDHEDGPAAVREHDRENLCSAEKMFDNPLPRPRFTTKYASIDDDTSLESPGDKFRLKLHTIFEETEEEREMVREILKARGPAPTYAPILEMARLPSLSDDEYEEPSLKSLDISIESSNFDTHPSLMKAPEVNPKPAPKSEFQVSPSPEPKRNSFSFPRPAKTTTALTTSCDVIPNYTSALPTPPTTPNPIVVESSDDTSCKHATASTTASADNEDANLAGTSFQNNSLSSDSESDELDYFLRQAGLDVTTSPADNSSNGNGTNPADPITASTSTGIVPESIPTINMTLADLDAADEYGRNYDRLCGYSLPRCTWALLDKPAAFGKCSGPLLMLTTPEGDIKYPEDMKCYDGAFNWADDSDEEEEEGDSDAYYASASPAATKST
ncbi:hypothetical protein SPBR_01358 [Sporothrix brasiliensis 5110]|uniref:Uncharacterized protein n=1 Tax=Sporothrix brasiliensis 5110 TaxID=1398154 RepID=A0A0C2FLI8_9PEZI|nr:uncharacterized protein SPBR_01358 [Sporothrix brasiliensis 5110]KIH91953.1 hypothetical protein SPBR_01358 [Sporothrix brasiliensis 5110]